MDTREKIVPLDKVAALLGTAAWVGVVGLFDPLTAVQACRLAEIAKNDGRKLLAIVLQADNALLSADARAALLAALRVVDLVATAEPPQWRCALADGADIQIIEDPEGERARSAEFIQFILDRQQSPTKYGSTRVPQPVPHK